MRNILKMNLYRMKRTKTTYILAIAAIAFSILYLGLNLLMDAAMTDIMGEEIALLPSNVFDAVMLQFSLAVVPMLALMYIMLFLNSEISSGYAKNIVGYEGNKFALAGANFITAAIYGSVIFLAATGIGVLLASVVYKTPVYTEGGKFAAYIVVALLEMFAFTELFIAFGDMKGKHVLMMIIGAICFMYAMLFYQLVNVGLSFFFDIEFALEKYTVLGCMTSFRISNPYGDFILSGVIALVVLVLSYFLDVWALKKRELK